MHGLLEAVVVDTNDPQQMGRLKVWVPALDGDLYEIDDLPWAMYTSPLAGQTRDYPAGPDGTITSGLVAYGLFAPPKAGALCVVGLMYGDPNRRVYLGAYFRDHGNRSLPAGRMRADITAAPVSDTLEPVQPQAANLDVQFQGRLTASEARTRGAYERAVAQDRTTKDGTEGYQAGVVDSTQLDPQTYALTTPGRHALIIQDNPRTGRVRLKTAAGHQVLLDDANERIYISTAKGRSWVELDQDGRVHVYAGDSLSMTTGGDLSLTAAGAVRVQAGGDLDLQAGGTTRLAGCQGLHASGATVNLESQGGFNVLAAGELLQTGTSIHLNGPSAPPAECPKAPTTVPAHEPWVRPASKGPRNPNWKP